MRAWQFELIVRSALGEYCLPDIRSVYIYYYWSRPPWTSGSWTDTSALLQWMRLTRVAFEFGEGLAPQELDSRIENSWASHVLELRSLHRLELWLNSHHGAEEDPRPVERLRKLLTAPGADERYRLFLEQLEQKKERIPNEQNSSKKTKKRFVWR
jgi:hypothetical protein